MCVSLCVFQLFKGKFYYCVGLDIKNITNKSDCLLAKYKWVHHKYNFDNLGQVIFLYFFIIINFLKLLLKIYEFNST